MKALLRDPDLPRRIGGALVKLRLLKAERDGEPIHTVTLPGRAGKLLQTDAPRASR